MLQLQNHHEARRIRLHLSANKEVSPSGGLWHSCSRALTAPEQCASSRLLCEDLSPQKHAATGVSEWLSLSWFQTRTFTPRVTPYGLVFCACCDLPWVGLWPLSQELPIPLKQRCRQPPATNSKINTPKCALREHKSDKMREGSKFCQVTLIYDIANRLEQFSWVQSM